MGFKWLVLALYVRINKHGHRSNKSDDKTQQIIHQKPSRPHQNWVSTGALLANTGVIPGISFVDPCAKIGYPLYG